MKKYILINILLSSIFANRLCIAPIIYANYESNGGTWSPMEKSIGVGGWGLTMEGSIDNFNILMDAYNSRFFGLTDKPNYFSHEQGLSWVGNDPGGEQFDFDVTNIKLSYNYKSIVFEMGKYSRHWGPGNSSLILSSKAPSFAQFGFTWDIGSTINFEYFHGSLRSLIEDDINSGIYEGIGAEVPEYNRYVVGHRINWDLSENLTIGATETIVYGVRNIDLLYLLPFAPFLSLQQYKGDLDNIQWEFDIDWNINDNHNLYFSFLMDEWDPSMTFDKPNRNWFGYQIGTKIKNTVIDNDNFILEYNWTDHRLYRHQNSINDYYSHGYPLGFWAGPHSQELYFNYTFNKFNSIFSISYSNAKRGELTNQMLENQYDNIVYERFSNISESLETFKILVTKELSNGFEIHFGITNIDWHNANFNPFVDEQEGLIDSRKNSFSLGFSHNFNPFTQSSKINDNSMSKIISL
tara:strand:- start:43 stop:1437 length:1395 start_codon:yes stop_codon:yes gene_type:complete